MLTLSSTTLDNYSPQESAEAGRMNAMASEVNRKRSSRGGPATVAATRKSGGTRYAVQSSRERIHPPRIADVDERIANIDRATKRIKTDVQVDFVRTRRGRR